MPFERKSVDHLLFVALTTARRCSHVALLGAVVGDEHLAVLIRPEAIQIDQDAQHSIALPAARHERRRQAKNRVISLNHVRGETSEISKQISSVRRCTRIFQELIATTV